ncbi:hypothetical protein FJR38_00575 [Anabaena sp. UHCC 0253]|uniref:hypothetical protein n=1 Tax=Anabaena sp. UHCC 0253 TaxID=2590019 RepID=UPI0014476631|nr:hypothetical protein [Anabaena sp. UHCC 0253]MTJ51285.1 hypothetical protein [Anabaena sp. UHCC 0253]
MEKIVIYDLYPIEIKTFINDLETLELETVLGGSFWGVSPNGGLSSNVLITTVFDGVNRFDNRRNGGGSFFDNKINTVDYSRTVNAWVYR